MTFAYDGQIKRIDGRSHVEPVAARLTNTVAYSTGKIIVLKRFCDARDPLQAEFIHLEMPSSRNRTELGVVRLSDWTEPAKGKEKTKSFSSLCLSQDGHLLAAGEQGQAPRIAVWNVRGPQPVLLHLIQAHMFGVRHLAFSEDTHYLVSIGSIHDGAIHVWDIVQAVPVTKLATNKVTSHLNAVLWIGNRIVTIGVRHIKVWQWTASRPPSMRRRSLEARDSASVLQGRNVILGSMVHEEFVAIASIDSMRCLIASRHAISLLTLGDAHVLEKVFELPEEHICTMCLSTENKLVTIGTKSGSILQVDITSLAKRTALPDGKAHGSDELCAYHTRSTYKSEIQSILELTSGLEIVSTIDGSMNTTLKADLLQRTITIPSRHACLGLQARDLATPRMWQGNGCVWNILDYNQVELYCNVNEEITAFIQVTDEFFVTGCHHGRLNVRNTTASFGGIQAHEGEVSLLALNEAGTILASTGRDRMVQIYSMHWVFGPDQTVSFPELRLEQTLNDHTGSIIAIIFEGCGHFLSASTDRTIALRYRVDDSDARGVFLPKKTFDFRSSPIALTICSKWRLLVSCQDKSFYSLVTDSATLIELLKAEDSYDFMAVCTKSNTVCCASASDKSICLRSVDTGILLSNSVVGHVDTITSLSTSGTPLEFWSTSIDGLLVQTSFSSAKGITVETTPVRKILKGEWQFQSPKYGSKHMLGSLRRSSSTPKLASASSRPASPSKLSVSTLTAKSIPTSGIPPNNTPERITAASKTLRTARKTTGDAVTARDASIPTDRLVDRVSQDLKLLEVANVDIADRERLVVATAWLHKTASVVTCSIENGSARKGSSDG